MALRIVPYDEFVALIHEIATEDPAFVYNNDSRLGCYYHKNPKITKHDKRCIIGEALFRLGMEEPELRTITQGANQELRRLGFDANTCRWARAVQIKQDEGASWSEAVQVTVEEE